jgi:succinyl-CoA synthetase beta subunit
MNIHEYQGKALLKANGVPVPEGVHCTTVEQALAAYDALGSKVVAVKSQIHAGGRGKGTLFSPDTRDHVMDGGVKIAFSKEEVETYATNILGNVLVTIQTGDEGKVVNNLYIEAGCAIAHEYYLAILVDRENKAVLVMASTEGGMDIEHVAETTPEKIHKITVDPNAGLLGYQKRDMGLALGLSGSAHKAFSKALSKMYSMFVANDCTMLEINPLVKTEDETIVALDA